MPPFQCLWQTQMFRYLHSRGFGFFYWCLNPESADTGGLLADGYVDSPEGSPGAAKLAMLDTMPLTRVATLLPPTAPPLVPPPGLLGAARLVPSPPTELPLFPLPPAPALLEPALLALSFSGCLPNAVVRCSGDGSDERL